MKTTVKILCTALLFLGPALTAVGNEADSFDVFLRMEKKRFFTHEEVRLLVSIRNRTDDAAAFMIYDSPDGKTPAYSTFQPRVFDMDGREIESIVQYRMQNRFTSDAISGMNPRSITLRSGETFTYSIDLRRVYSMAPGKQYRVRCYFIPDFTRRNVLYSRNELSFALDERREKAFDRQAPVIAADITPSEIVLLTLEAEKKGHGERMLKYIDVEEYINTYSDFVRSYSQAGNLERQEILERFREYLTRPRGDYLIDYRVTGEELGGDVAYVDAYVDRHGIRKNDTYRYRYALKKTRNMWLITGLEATYSKGKPQ